MTTTDILNTIRKRLDAATPGPWQAIIDEDLSHHCTENCRRGQVVYDTDISVVMESSAKDAEFIAASRTDLDKLEKALRVAIDALSGYSDSIYAITALSEIEVILNDH